MRHLITGAAGFIGSNLARRLVAEGEDVVGIDCFTDYYSRVLKESNIEDIINEENFLFIEGNLLELDLESILSDIDYVYHEAAQAGVRASWGDSFEIYSQNNILLTQKLLEAAKKADLKKFVYASSSSVYGDTDNLPMSEDDRLQPVSPYGVSKLAGENLCYLYWKNFEVPVVSLRYFTVFGEGQRPDMAFHIFIKAVLEQEPITVFGDGEQSRNFTYINDVVRANILAACSKEQGKIFNIGGASEGITVNQVIDSIFEISEKKTEVIYQSQVKGDVRHTAADCSQAAELLNYQPEFDFREGLKNQIEWEKKIY